MADHMVKLAEWLRSSDENSFRVVEGVGPEDPLCLHLKEFIREKQKIASIYVMIDEDSELMNFRLEDAFRALQEMINAEG